MARIDTTVEFFEQLRLNIRNLLDIGHFPVRGGAEGDEEGEKDEKGDEEEKPTLEELQASNSRLETSLKKERAKSRTAKDNLEKLKGEDILTDDQREEYDRLKSEETAREGKKLISEGDVDKLVTARIAEGMKAKDTEIGDLTEKLTSTSSDLDVAVIDNHLRSSANDPDLGFVPMAVEDMLLYSRVPDAQGRRWSREGREPVLREADGEIVYGKDPAVPMTGVEWLGSLVESKRHWFGKGEGSGAEHQTKKGNATQFTNRSKMTPAQKAKVVNEANERGEDGTAVLMAIPE